MGQSDIDEYIKKTIERYRSDFLEKELENNSLRVENHHLTVERNLLLARRFTEGGKQLETSDLTILTDTVDNALYRVRKLETELKLIQLTLKQFARKKDDKAE